MLNFFLLTSHSNIFSTINVCRVYWVRLAKLSLKTLMIFDKLILCIKSLILPIFFWKSIILSISFAHHHIIEKCGTIKDQILIILHGEVMDLLGRSQYF